MTQTARRYALLPICLVSVTALGALGACGAPSSGSASSTNSDTLAAPSSSDSASASTSTTAGPSDSSTAGASTSPTTSPSGDPTAAVAGPAAPATVTITVTPSGTAYAPAASSTSTAGATDAVSASPSATQNLATVPSSRLGGCISRGLTAYTMNLTGLDGAAKQTAQAVYHAARVCDPSTLIKLANRDSTKLSYQKVSARSLFAIPQTTEVPYDSIIKIMGTQPVVASINGGQSYIWPRVVGQPKDPAAWTEAVNAGLISQKQSAQMQAGGGYYGPQIWIDSKGAWRVFTR